MEKKFSPQSIFTLKEALSVIFWKRDDLKDFLTVAIENNAIVNSISWGGTKRQTVNELIERMINRLDIYGNDLLSLFIAVSDFDDFSNLKFWDDDGSKTKVAMEAVSKLRNHTKGYIQKTKELEESEKRRKETAKKIEKSRSLVDQLNSLKERFYVLAATKDLQKRGYDLEKFLYDLFLLYDLEPKGSFKIYGEQIDGAFTFQGTDYLLEAKWKKLVDRSDLAAFCYKVENKFKTGVGLLVTIEGVTSEAISPDFKSIIIMDGLDITTILDGRVSLTDLLFKKRRRAVETGKIYLNYSQL